MGQDLSDAPPIATDLITEPHKWLCKWPPPAPTWGRGGDRFLLHYEISGIAIKEPFPIECSASVETVATVVTFSQSASIPICVPSQMSAKFSPFPRQALPSFILKGKVWMSRHPVKGKPEEAVLKPKRGHLLVGSLALKPANVDTISGHRVFPVFGRSKTPPNYGRSYILSFLSDLSPSQVFWVGSP